MEGVWGAHGLRSAGWGWAHVSDRPCHHPFMRASNIARHACLRLCLPEGYVPAAALGRRPGPTTNTTISIEGISRAPLQAPMCIERGGFHTASVGEKVFLRCQILQATINTELATGGRSIEMVPSDIIHIHISIWVG